MSPVLSLPHVLSPLGAAPAAHSLPGEREPWQPPQQHLCLSRAIFSCWPRGCGSHNPDPTREPASLASGKTGREAAGLGCFFAGRRLETSPGLSPPRCTPAAAPSRAAGAFSSASARSRAVAQPCLVHLASLGSG